MSPCLQKRKYSLDVLKVVAIFFVVLLHVNGYAVQTFSIEQYTKVTKYIYCILEAIAYPAIHIFTLIGSYFMLERAPKIKSCMYIYANRGCVASGIDTICFNRD